MRIKGKGIISNANPVRFTFDGAGYSGFDQDTLASALLANDVRLMARSFKYHRPRGVMTAGSEEPNALVSVGSGAARMPNVRATMQELFDGLKANSQNCWPRLNADLMAVNDLMAPFFSAGFYYKTFMWPRAFWDRLYEPMIRRAAGIGALPDGYDGAPYEKAFAFCDLLIIGAGPAGLMAALLAGRAGADVIVVDENTRCGGQLLNEVEVIAGRAGHHWAAEAEAELRNLPNVRVMTRTTVTGAFDQGTFGALERHRNDAKSENQPLETFWRIVAKRALLCAGALERPIAFANNDRPGIMMAGAVRAYLNRYGVAAGHRVAVFGNNDNAHRTARDLTAAGIEVTAVVDSRAAITFSGDFPVFSGAQVVNTAGRLGLEQITVRQGGADTRIEADCLAVSGGWNPSLHLTCHMGGRPTWNDQIAAFIPTPGSVPGLDSAGASLGVFSTKSVLKSAKYRMNLILEDLGFKVATTPLPQAGDDPYGVEPCWAVPGRARAWLDFQNDVTVKDVTLAARENFASVEHMKRYTTQGMAPDQGKSSNVLALAVLADATGQGIPETGTTTFRPPYQPVAIAAMGAGAEGKGFAPERFTTSHQASLDRGAPMIEAGLWYRPSYFPRQGEKNWRQSCDREVTMVRDHVGVCDVSTLGKIDIQGKDAGKLLDFVYINMFSTLPVGKVRYGLMLREDGFVMDDGTCACLAKNHFVMTTTTAAAGPVMKHLEFVCQVLRPDWDVQIASVTEHWAQFAVAGPKSRALVNAVLDAPVDGDVMPYMGCAAVHVGGIGGRLFRISFSGEHAYELAVPARYGDSLFRLLVSQAEALGGGAYGMEALNVLRIEKGFITHAEIDGRVTAFDLGLGRMVSAKKDCIGKTMAARPGLVGADREQLVGLRPIGAVKQLTAGAFLFADGADVTRENAQGHVTSVGYSPAMGHFLGLGFLVNGRARHGETVRLVDHLRGLVAACRVTDPVVYDPEGGRLRG